MVPFNQITILQKPPEDRFQLQGVSTLHSPRVRRICAWRSKCCVKSLQHESKVASGPVSTLWRLLAYPQAQWAVVILLCSTILYYLQEFLWFQWKSTLRCQRNNIMVKNHYIIPSGYSGLALSSVPQRSCFTYIARDHSVVDHRRCYCLLKSTCSMKDVRHLCLDYNHS